MVYKNNSFRKDSLLFNELRAESRKKNFNVDYNSKRFVVFPKIRDEKQLAKVINQLNFGLAYGRKNSEVYIYVTNDMLKTKLSRLKVPQYQANYLSDTKMIHLISEREIQEHLDNDHILLHQGDAFKKALIRDRLYKTDIIDPNFYSTTEAETIRRILNQSLTKEEKEAYFNKSLKRFNKLLLDHDSQDKAYCFASGPSFDKYKDYEIDNNSFKVICNSIIKNEEFIQHIGGADLLVFADPVFHFSFNQYSETFRQDVLRYIKKTPSYIAIPDYVQPLLESLYPELEPYLIGIPAISPLFHIVGSSEEEFSVKGTGNILTLFMLPIAAAVANQIFILGVDGRKKNETYFWQHSKTAQYHDKMKDAFETHPSFFRDRDYEGYYDDHLVQLETLLARGEEMGKTYIGMNPTYIPSFIKRNADPQIRAKYNRKQKTKNLIKSPFRAFKRIFPRVSNIIGNSLKKVLPGIYTRLSATIK